MHNIKIIGAEAEAIEKAIAFKADGYASTDSKIELLIILPHAQPPFPECKILLMPDELLVIPNAETAISYGMSSKCSITLSSVRRNPVLAIQREISTLAGVVLEPQEIPLKNWYNLSEYSLMASVTALLLLGIYPESLS